MPALEVITYSAPAELAKLADRAASVWNDVMQGLAVLKKAGYPHITIKFGSVDRASDPTRVAQCADHPGKRWTITLANDIKWRLSWWDRVFGRGEDTFACLVHEFGHIFDLPHSSDPRDVMHPSIGGNGKLSAEESANYREFFLKHISP